MRVAYLFLLLILIFFQSCSTSSDGDMIIEEEMQMEEMEMEEEMQMDMEEEASNPDVLSGDFISGAHTTAGKASVDDSKTTLSFTSFKTDEGPLLEIYLATDTSASTYITLGAIKGVDGNYEYALPNNVDLATYNHVLVWCVTFSVNFGHAVLN
tara:strand:+ start:329 stop:790 length:462 start_codon:yes stop_codon:yes gene_type:complete